MAIGHQVPRSALMPFSNAQTACTGSEGGELRESAMSAHARTVVGMGFNPFRPQTRTAFDIAMVVGAIALTLAVVAWAIFAG